MQTVTNRWFGNPQHLLQQNWLHCLLPNETTVKVSSDKPELK